MRADAVSHAGSRRTSGWLWVLLAVGTAALATEFAADLVWKLRYQGWGDFRSYYAAAWALRMHQDPYDPAALNRVWEQVGDPTLKADTRAYAYPPLFALALQPLTGLRVVQAARLWMVLNAALWVASVLALMRYLGVGPGAPLYWLTLCIAFRFEPARTTLALGQVNILVFVLVLAALAAEKAGRSAASGLALATASMLKLTPAFLVAYLLLRRRYRTVAWTAAGFLALLAAGCAAVGTGPHLTFFTEVLPWLGRGVRNAQNQSLTGLFLRLAGPRGPGGVPSWAVYGARAVGLLLVALVGLALSRSRLRPASVAPCEVALCIVLVSLISPITWSHHLVWVILPVACVLRDAPELLTRPLAAFAALTAFVLVGLLDDFYVHPLFRSGIPALVSAAKTFGLLAFLALLVRQVAWRGAQPDRGVPA